MNIFIVMLVGGILYFLPSIVARNKRDFWGIFVMNLFLGWTFMGWVFALIWAVSSERINN